MKSIKADIKYLAKCGNLVKTVHIATAEHTCLNISLSVLSGCILFEIVNQDERYFSGGYVLWGAFRGWQ